MEQQRCSDTCNFPSPLYMVKNIQIQRAFFMQNNKPKPAVFWYQKQYETVPALQENISVDFVIVGGGMAGLMAAYHARKRGYSVVLLEKAFCGGGASGKSSGFITPDSEWELSHFVKKFGEEHAHQLWRFALSGCHDILRMVQEHAISCDYQKQDTCILALNTSGYKHIVEEYGYRVRAGYTSSLYTQENLTEHLPATGYQGGVQYTDTFGINPYAFCQSMKQILQELGVRVYENTAVTAVQEHTVTTRAGYTARAEHIIVCVDRWAPELSCFTNDVSHVQTILMASQPISDAMLAQIFPQQSMMIWDTDLLYTYYRPTGDKRILLGGSDLINTYTTKEQWHGERVIKKLQRYWEAHFPKMPLVFEYAWPGLIGVSKDIMPVAGFDCVYPSVYGIAAASGLPWAAALGRYCIERIIDNNTQYDDFFSSHRSFPVGACGQKILGKKLSFMLSHGITEFLGR